MSYICRREAALCRRVADAKETYRMKPILSNEAEKTRIFGSSAYWEARVANAFEDARDRYSDTLVAYGLVGTLLEIIYGMLHYGIGKFGEIE